MSQLALSFLAGGLSSLSPCVLPTFPVVAGGALQAHRFGPVALALGMITSFTALAITLSATGTVLGLDDTQARTIAASMLLAFGLILVSSKLNAKAASVTVPIATFANRLLGKWTPKGLLGQWFIGLMIGAIWMPCAGPTLGAALTLASQGESIGVASTMMILFGIGASVPLLLVAYGSKNFFRNRSWHNNLHAKGRIVFGALLIGFGLMALTGGDKWIEARLVEIVPTWILSISTKF